ncbi:LacI family DNA-binding transcriptional regulator [Levyella massiliensis]|uniref:LacI family DNA-binding transcriptional regulator n=1 Tax=Levyella massiliensis TaxID=938289 RepID=UPI0024AE4C78|nr:LacI family DNA-binding transcriptional regulator [Levyella massiliensis]
MAQPTIKDVAKLAGVSISTVSRVMNKSKPVSPEAQRKVLDAINKLGFKPNELARSLVMKKSNSIGILVKDIGIHYMAEMIRGAEEIGRMYHYDILLSSTYGEHELEQRAIDFLYRKQVEGVIIISESIEPETIVKIKEYHLPFVLLDRFYKSADLHTVTIRHREAMKEMTDYVLSLGNRSVRYLRSSLSYDFSKERSLGYDEAMRAHDLTPVKWEADGDDAEAGYKAAEAFTKHLDKEPFDAVICENDDLAVGVMTYCYDHGIVIPKAFQVAGFGGSPYIQIFRPRLTSMEVPYYDIGAVVMRALTKTLQGKNTLDETLYLPTQILVGESTEERK